MTTPTPSTQEIICFYHQDDPYGCFSNFSLHEFEIDGTKFKTSEHYLMYSKAMLFGDAEMAQKILDAPSCMHAKRYGRLVKNFDEGVWASKRLEIMIEGLKAKTNQNPTVKETLLSTGDKKIVEASPRDAIWGSGCGAKKLKLGGKMTGLNLLGVAWMFVRTELSN